MRKIFALVLAMLMVMSAAAVAEGALSVTKETYKIVETDYGTYGYLFVKVENTGDAPIALGNGTLAVFDADNAILETSDYISGRPYNAIIEPGDYVYMEDTTYFDDGITAANVGQYMLSVKPYEYEGDSFVKIPCEAVLNMGVETYDSDYIDVTFTNTTDSVLYGYEIVTAMYDAAGNLVNVDYDWYSNVGIHPGATVTLKVYQDSTVLEALEAENNLPATVDAYVYYELY